MVRSDHPLRRTPCTWPRRPAVPAVTSASHRVLGVHSRAATADPAARDLGAPPGPPVEGHRGGRPARRRGPHAAEPRAVRRDVRAPGGGAQLADRGHAEHLRGRPRVRGRRARRRSCRSDVEEVVNYVRAMNYGLDAARDAAAVPAADPRDPRGAAARASRRRADAGRVPHVAELDRRRGRTLAHGDVRAAAAHEMLAALGDLETIPHDRAHLPPLLTLRRSLTPSSRRSIRSSTATAASAGC